MGRGRILKLNKSYVCWRNGMSKNRILKLLFNYKMNIAGVMLIALAFYMVYLAPMVWVADIPVFIIGLLAAFYDEKSKYEM